MPGSNAFWNEKVVVITGASSGIGLALAQHCYSQGARVGMIARRGELLAEFAGGMKNGPGVCAWELGDVSNCESTRRAIDALECQLGPCDIVVANAGIYRQTNGIAFPTQVASEIINVNLQGVIHTVGAVLPGMVRRQRGHLVAVSSILALLGFPGAAVYSASKAAVVRLMDGLRIDLLGQGVRVTTICPGYVDTPMVTAEERATLRSLVPVDRAALRIARAIERGRPTDWFPWTTHLLARLANLLPYPIFNAVMRRQAILDDCQVPADRSKRDRL